MMRFIAYLASALVVTTAVHLYLHRRLVRDTALTTWRRPACIALFAGAALLPLGMVGLLVMRTASRSFTAPLMWCAFTWVGLLLFLLPMMLVGELRRPTDPARRRVMAGAMGALTLVLGGASAVIAQLPLIVRRFRIPLANLGASMSGYKVVQISDLHVSATIGRELVEAVVARVNALDPDLIAITGDLVDGSVKDLGPLLAPLAALRARDGVYFVTGNHEYLSGVDEWVAFMPTLGFRVLRNERVAIGGEHGFDLIGIDDPSGTPDLHAALRGRDTTRASVLLAHRPDEVAAAARHGIGLQLSGHTHGGQVSPLGWLLERAHQPYVFGLYAVEKTALYVTSGAGYWGPPMRLGTRAEIALFELVK